MEVPFEPIRVLYVGPDEATSTAVSEQLRNQEMNVEVVTVQSTAAAIEFLDDDHVDCIVAAFDLGSDDGIALLERLRERGVSLPFILFPDTNGDEIASRAVTAGVDRYRPNTSIEESVGELASDIVEVIEEHTPEEEILDRMTDAFMALDDQWRFTYLNERGREIICEAIGETLSTAELRGRTIWDEIPDIVGTTFHERYTEAMETQEPVAFEEYYEPLGRWFEVRAFPSASGLSVYFYDITDRHNYEAELERREEVLRDIYWIIADKELSFEEKVEQLLQIGQEELEMTYGSLSRIDGDSYTLEVVVGPDHDMITEGTTVPLSSTNCERVVEQESHLDLADIEAEAPDLFDRLVVSEMGLESYVGAPVFVENAVDGTFCLYDFETNEDTFSDWEITLVDLMASWVSYEREREYQRRELERERNRLDDVASTLSHDLRNPLTTANLRLDLAAEECNSDHLADVESALDRIDQLVSDVLAMARLGKQVIEPEPVDFEALVRETWQTTSVGGDLRIEDDIETVVGDEGRLRQLFENLFRNAVEHTTETSRESLVVTVGSLDECDGFYVADNGPGIPEEGREQVFERGYSTQQNGTGFGLSIVKEVVEAHGGTITVTESDSGGARFEIRGIETRSADGAD
jgi:signal transduction histidine kinase/DNA-binding NarL/FixJ family response regulator